MEWEKDLFLSSVARLNASHGDDPEFLLPGLNHHRRTIAHKLQPHELVLHSAAESASLADVGLLFRGFRCWSVVVGGSASVVGSFQDSEWRGLARLRSKDRWVPRPQLRVYVDVTRAVRDAIG